jgi:hypothetical protein
MEKMHQQGLSGNFRLLLRQHFLIGFHVIHDLHQGSQTRGPQAA